MVAMNLDLLPDNALNRMQIGHLACIAEREGDTVGARDGGKGPPLVNDETSLSAALAPPVRRRRPVQERGGQDHRRQC